MECPICEKEAEAKGDAWVLGSFKVKEFYCSKCKKRFNVYYYKNAFWYGIH
jgi:transposase-like protein